MAGWPWHVAAWVVLRAANRRTLLGRLVGVGGGEFEELLAGLRRKRRGRFGAGGVRGGARQRLPDALDVQRIARRAVLEALESGARLAEGQANKEVATALGISPKTVEAHRTEIMRKLHLGSFRDLVRYAVRERIVRDGASLPPRHATFNPPGLRRESAVRN